MTQSATFQHKTLLNRIRLGELRRYLKSLITKIYQIHCQNHSTAATKTKNWLNTGIVYDYRLDCFY